MQIQTYILVHGAWHGSWCWHKIKDHLEKAGHTVLTPDLPGHYHNNGDFRQITFKRYVETIEQLLRQCQAPIVLVGHSMAGYVITQVAENRPQMIQQLVYISGFIPLQAGSLIEEEKKARHPTVSQYVKIEEATCSIALPLNDEPLLTELFYKNCSKRDQDYALAHLQDQPLRPFMGSVSLSKGRYRQVPKLYIECLQDNAINIHDQRRMQQYIDCRVETLDTDHSPFFSADHVLAKILLQLT